jgi:hypothetical protein
VEGATTAAIFEAYPSKKCSPRAYTARAGDVVMDNFTAHKEERLRENWSSSGGMQATLYLPPTLSSELNPMEEAFSKMKGILSAQSGGQKLGGPDRGARQGPR